MKTILALIIALGTFAFFPATAEAGDSKHKRMYQRYIVERYYQKHHHHNSYGYGCGYVDRHHPGAAPRYDYYGHRVDSHGHHVDRHGHHR